MDEATRTGTGEPGPFTALKRGFLQRCPACGRGRLFGRFLKVADRCRACGTEFHHHRADDFPPYIVMLIVGHVVVYGNKGAVVGLRYALGMHGFGAAKAAERAAGKEHARGGHEGAEHHGSTHLHGT